MQTSLKVWLFMSLLTLSTNSVASSKIAEADLKKIFNKPLIIGASVSADYLAESPGKRLAKRYTKSSEIVTKAIGGRAGRDLLPTLAAKTFDDRSVVVGIDLFFWDSTFRDPKPSLAALDRLMTDVKKRNLPIVLGEIPGLLPSRQPQRAALNAAIHKACASYENCYVMPFDDLLSRIMKDWSLEIKGRKYSLLELVPDGLHMGDVAGDYLADMMKDVLLGKS
jgi:hypothetical protein